MTILKMSFSSGILILVVAAIRTTMLYRLPKKTFWVLWGVTLCRLLIPFFVPSRFSIYTITDMLKTNTAQTDIRFFTENASSIAAIGNAESGGAFNGIITHVLFFHLPPVAILWLVGLSVCALFFFTTHFHHLWEYKTSLPIDSEFIEMWSKDHPTWRRIKIRQSDTISSALTYGLLRPVVLLPKTTDWTDETKLCYILTHEYAHIRRFDILYKLLLCISVCVHWFNPLVWVMYVLANRDIELSCDETVVRTFGESARSSYALTLIELEEKKSLFSPLMNSFSKNAIEERTVSIMKTKKFTFAGIALAFVLVIGIVMVFATDSPASVPTGRIYAAFTTVRTAAQKIFPPVYSSDNTVTVNSSADMITKREVISLTNGITLPHDAANGHLVIYKNENENWVLSEGETLELEVDIAEILKDGQTAVIGYITDDIYTDIFTGKIKGSKLIEFTAPEDGEYAFYLIGASSDTIHVQSFSVK